MAKTKIHYAEHYEAVMKALTTQGLLLGSYDAAGKANAMTIGWGSMGSIWGIPLWIVLVRPSRYTYQCIEHTGCFSVNVPGDDLSAACAAGGSKSGRDVDKFAECGLTAEKGAFVLAPLVAEAVINYECQVVHRNDVLPSLSKQFAHQGTANETCCSRYDDHALPGQRPCGPGTACEGRRIAAGGRPCRK